MAAGPGRPFVLVSPGGRLRRPTPRSATSAPHRRDAEDGPTQDHPGVDFHSGSTGSLVRTSLLRNGTGLTLDGSQGVHLEDVTVSGSAGTGLVLRGDRGTTMSGVRAEHNGADGVQVTGPSTDRPITGISTTGNGGFGIDHRQADRAPALRRDDRRGHQGGVDVQQSSDVTRHRPDHHGRAHRGLHPRQQQQRRARPADQHRRAARA